MPAATPGPPSLEDLLTILSRVSNLRVNFVNITDPSGNTIELCFEFKRGNLGPAGIYVFEHPSMIFPAILALIGADEAMEHAFRAGDPAKTIDDCIAFIDQMARGIDPSMGPLFAQQARAHFASTLKYLNELSRRRREIDRRANAGEELRRKAAEEEVARKVKEEIKRREEEIKRAKREAHARWEKEEAAKAKGRSQRTSNSGYDPGKGPFNSGPPPGFKNEGPYGNMFEDMMNEARRQGWGEEFKTHFEGVFGGSAFYGGNTAAPPPPSNGKRKWFEILGCKPAANRDEIRRAAREAAKGLHPDIPGQDTPENQAKIREINEAKAEGLQGCSA